jgi:hypothetical protein
VSTLSQASSYVDAVREAAEDPRGAYLIRSRIRRALLTCVRGVAEERGLEKPIYAGQWLPMNALRPEEQELVDICRRTYQRAERLCQPSESFDVRWEAGWAALQDDLIKLQSALSRLN